MNWNQILGPIVEKLVTDRISVYNGVAARDTVLTDAADHFPNHKQKLCNAVTDNVTTDDEVVVVGGGRGVVPVKAAQEGASVTVYEAATEMVDILHETQALNQVKFETRHAVVGGEYDIYGTSDGADVVPPAELDGDVLVLDCEGAELDILPVEGFRTIIVETHPAQNATTEAVSGRLEDSIVYAADPVDGHVVIA